MRFMHREKNLLTKYLGAVAACAKKTTELGENRVLNATIGALCDEQGKLVLLRTVEKVFRGLSNQDIAALWQCKRNTGIFKCRY